MKEIELTDYQTFITSRARENYFEVVKNKYDFVRFVNEDCQYRLYLYTVVGPQDHLTFPNNLIESRLDKII